VDAAERQLGSVGSPTGELVSSPFAMTGYSINIGRHPRKSLIKNPHRSNYLNHYFSTACAQFHEHLSWE
jgi:hypothetical protein